MAKRALAQRKLAAAVCGGTLFLFGALAGCAQVLGIEEAHVDPQLTASANPMGAGGSGTDAGRTGDAATPDAMPSSEAATDGGGQPEAAADAGIDGAPSAMCQVYCSDVTSYCTGNVRQYIDIAQCLKVCSLFPEGAVGVEGNTAACRGKYASKARYAAGSELDVYCRKAGPASDGTCGAICESYCMLMMPTCTASRTAPYFFGSMSDCMSNCGAVDDEPPYTVADGTLPDRYSAQCRMFHATSAVMDPDEHCEHAMGVTMCDVKVDAGHD